jgi:hypothetical protein
MEADKTKLVVVKKSKTVENATLVKQLLEDNGIRSAFWDENMAAVFPSIETLFPVKIVVNEQDAEKAKKIIAELRESEK